MNKAYYMIYLWKHDFQDFLDRCSYICQSMVYKKHLDTEIYEMAKWNDLITIMKLKPINYPLQRFNLAYKCRFCDFCGGVKTVLCHMLNIHELSRLCPYCHMILQYRAWAIHKKLVIRMESLHMP